MQFLLSVVTRTFDKSRHMLRPTCLPSPREVLRKLMNLLIGIILDGSEQTVIFKLPNPQFAESKATVFVA
jgi:hypothetical protein